MVSLEQFEELRLRLVAYEAQQAVGQAEMKSEVKDQVSEATDGLKGLYITRPALRWEQLPHELINSKRRSAAVQCRGRRVCFITRI